MMTQEYSAYTPEDFEIWKILYDRQMEVLPNRASDAFFEGIEKTGFTADAIPEFSFVNKRLHEATGWGLEVVPGLIKNKPFFECLENKLFPATTWLRTREKLDYLQEPDMFHDVFGHVPLLTNTPFVGFLNGLSGIALRYIDNEYAIELISRLYWFTVEFGLIQEEGVGLRIYGAGILSSPGESVFCLESDIPKRYPFDVEHIMRTPYIIDRYQDHYWVINSYEQLYNSVPVMEKVLEKMLKEAESL